MKSHRNIQWIAIVILLLWGIPRAATGAPESEDELVVIVHPSNSTNSISLHTLKRIYLRKNYMFPGDVYPEPVDISDDTQDFEAFIRLVLEMSPERWKREWSQRIFRGQGSPPRQMENYNQVLTHVANTPSAIGYVPRSMVNARVKMVRVRNFDLR